MRKIFSIILFSCISTLAFSQIPKNIETYEYYPFESMETWGDSCRIGEKLYPKEICRKIDKANSLYSQSPSKKEMRFIKFLFADGTLEHTEYDFDPEMSPFGEYVNYYPNGKIKSKYYFQEPNDSLTNRGTMEGKWIYLSVNGDTIGIKRYKNGFAHGKWVAYSNDSAYVVKEFKNGFSEGFWEVHKLHNGGETYLPHAFHNGFCHSVHFCDENFETIIDKAEYVYQKEKIIEIEKIEYGEGMKFIKNGKFYILRDGIYVGLKEYKNEELIRNIKYDYH